MQCHQGLQNLVLVAKTKTTSEEGKNFKQIKELNITANAAKVSLIRQQ